jgi:molybdenum cofactor cytidylyltransferase
MIPAVVLAAGASRRMGRPKALLPLGHTTFVRRIVEALEAAEVTNIFVIVRHEIRDLVATEIEGVATARVVVNPHAEDGQLSSLVTALDTIDEAGAVLVTLVDVPLVRPSTIRALIARAGASPALILRAVHHGRHGHPVIFKHEVFAALRSADPALGAKAVMRAVAVEDVEVDDPGIVSDVDTPEDYRSLLTREVPNQ